MYNWCKCVSFMYNWYSKCEVLCTNEIVNGWNRKFDKILYIHHVPVSLKIWDCKFQQKRKSLQVGNFVKIWKSQKKIESNYTIVPNLKLLHSSIDLKHRYHSQRIDYSLVIVPFKVPACVKNNIEKKIMTLLAN